jgi:hypothetical protein
LDSS